MPKSTMRSERATIKIVMKNPEKNRWKSKYHGSKEVIDHYSLEPRSKSNHIDENFPKDKISTLKADNYKTKTENKRTAI